MTREEKFLFSIYQSKEEVVDALKLGKALGYSEKQVTQILRALGQSNLIKKLSDYEICLTLNGKELIHILSKR